MATKLFVGSLPYKTNDDELAQLFAEAGTVVSAKVIIDRETNRSKGFGFVEMSSEDEAQAAIKNLNGREIEGRAIIVNEARPQENRGPRPGGFGGGNGGGNDRRY
jgi:cold-inducible RNA-binding protein